MGQGAAVGSPCLGSPPVHGGNGSEPSSNVAHCDSVKAMFGTAPGSELWSVARTAVPWHEHKEEESWCHCSRDRERGVPKEGTVSVNTLQPSPLPLREIQDLPSGVFRPQLCDPMIPGDLLLQVQYDPETLCPISPFPPFYVHNRALEHSSIY